mmetsp:Transcript_6190/g.15027  ORF Transcript_6190/g.15027 Transcript_6190/m.15027 type:complete len:333 (-) Transcript_6190:1450-2448(-)
MSEEAKTEWSDDDFFSDDEETEGPVKDNDNNEAVEEKAAVEESQLGEAEIDGDATMDHDNALGEHNAESASSTKHSTGLPPRPTPNEPESASFIDSEDQDFEEIVRKRNKVRKEREDYHIAHIKVQMGRLEDALAAETKRRVDATTALDELARTQVHEMEERVRSQLREENETLQRRLSALEERVTFLEQNWQKDADHQIRIVNQKSADLTKSISQIRDEQNMERKARLKREGILLQQVEGHARDAQESWRKERKDRIQKLEHLEKQIIRNEARLALEQKRYEDKIESELAALRQEVETEAMEREVQDETIVAALNRYTKQLQHSLSILSSD